MTLGKTWRFADVYGFLLVYDRSMLHRPKFELTIDT